MKQITQLGKGKFAVKSADNTELKLNFNPIIDRLPDKLKKPKFYLIHWQGRPKGDREWGIYDPRKDTYRCGIYGSFPVGYGAIAPVMLDDKTATTIPSAVIWFSGSLAI